MYVGQVQKQERVTIKNNKRLLGITTGFIGQPSK